MNIQALGNTIKSTAVRTGYVLKDHSPQILTGTSIACSVAAVGFAVHSAYKKLPKIQEEYDTALWQIQKDISDPRDDALRQLEELGDEVINDIFAEHNDGNPQAEQQREYVTNLNTVCENGAQLEAAYVTKAKLQRIGNIALAFLPSALCLAASITCSVLGLRINTRRLIAAGATITALTTELAVTRKELKSAIGEAAMNQMDRDNIEATKTVFTDENGNDSSVVENLKKRLYQRVYDGHLMHGLELDECLKIAQVDLRDYERAANHKLVRDGRFYYGDALRSLGFETDRCGQNCGWAVREAGDDRFDGYIDFGCWITNPETGIKTLNPANIMEDGSILLDFNVEGDVVDVATFRA